MFEEKFSLKMNNRKIKCDKITLPRQISGILPAKNKILRYFSIKS